MKVIRFCLTVLARLLLFPHHLRSQAEVSGSTTVATQETLVPSAMVPVTDAVYRSERPAQRSSWK
jgi:hypothetical protein